MGYSELGFFCVKNSSRRFLVNSAEGDVMSGGRSLEDLRVEAAKLHFAKDEQIVSFVSKAAGLGGAATGLTGAA